MPLRCDLCEEIIPPNSRIYCCHDKQFCSTQCALSKRQEINEIDPEFKYPQFWNPSQNNATTIYSKLVSIMVTIFSYII